MEDERNFESVASLKVEEGGRGGSGTEENGRGRGRVNLGVAAALVVDVEGQGVVEHVEVPAAIVRQ